jgi:hypothetical protein
VKKTHDYIHHYRAVPTGLRGASRASRRSSASASILAFLSLASSTDNQSFTARISSLASTSAIPIVAIKSVSRLICLSIPSSG